MLPPSHLLVSDRGAVRTVTLNRPEKRNALHTPLIEDLLAALDAADQDDSIGASVLTGAGSLFCAGADMGEFRDAGADAYAMSDRRSDLLIALQLRFGELKKPVIAALNGSAIGAGAALALAADMVVMSADAKLGYPETRHALIPSLMIGTLLRHVGRKAAFELLATGDSIDAQRALLLGLVNGVVAPGEVLPEACRLAASLAALDRHALAGTKRVLNACADLPLADALRQGRALAKQIEAERKK